MKTRTTTTVSLTDKRQTPWQNLRQLLLCLLILLPGILTAQTIENPTFKARNGSIRNITRIERTPECTKVYIHAIFRPHWWIKEDDSKQPIMLTRVWQVKKTSKNFRIMRN